MPSKKTTKADLSRELLSLRLLYNEVIDGRTAARESWDRDRATMQNTIASERRSVQYYKAEVETRQQRIESMMTMRLELEDQVAALVEHLTKTTRALSNEKGRVQWLERRLYPAGSNASTPAPEEKR